MRKVLNITLWPTPLVFLLAGSVAAIFAFVTVNLFSLAAASWEFLATFGVEAIRHGALWQVLDLLVWGTVALSSWIMFKVCEHILEERYLAWANASKQSQNDSSPASRNPEG